MEKLAKKSKFSIDGGTAFNGYTFGQTWNGWSCPSFELSEALKIAEEASMSEEYKLTYDSEKNCFVEWYSDADINTYEEATTYKANVILTENGPIEVFDIGAYGWVWDNESDFNNGKGRTNES